MPSVNEHGEIVRDEPSRSTSTYPNSGSNAPSGPAQKDYGCGSLFIDVLIFSILAVLGFYVVGFSVELVISLSGANLLLIGGTLWILYWLLSKMPVPKAGKIGFVFGSIVLLLQ